MTIKYTEDRTLMVKKIVNLTEKTMWVYDSEGGLVELKPEWTHKETILKTPAKGVYYAVSVGTAKDLINDEISDHLVIPVYLGEGRMGEALYHFQLFTSSVERPINVELTA